MNNASEWNTYLRLTNEQNKARADLVLATRAMEKATAAVEASPVMQKIRDNGNRSAA